MKKYFKNKAKIFLSVLIFVLIFTTAIASFSKLEKPREEAKKPVLSGYSQQAYKKDIEEEKACLAQQKIKYVRLKQEELQKAKKEKENKVATVNKQTPTKKVNKQVQIKKTNNSKSGKVVENKKSNTAVPETKTENDSEFLASNNFEFLNNVENEVLNLCNIERQKIGADPLVMDASLKNVARFKAKEMMTKGYYSHCSPYTGDIDSVAESMGYSDWTLLAENIQASKGLGKSQVTARYLVNNWMSSSGHRSNILNKSYTKMGIGVVWSGDGNMSYESQLFSN